MTLLELAMKLRPLIEQAAASLDDKDASAGPQLFPKLKHDGSLVKAGTRINWNGVIKRAAVDLWDTDINNPDSAPTLWEDISYREGIRVIPTTITAGTAFSKDELGWWGDKMCKSLIDANVWTPDSYPAGWMFIDD